MRFLPVLLTCCLLDDFVAAAPPESDRPIGWASVVGGTTGGFGGQRVVAKDAAEFASLLKGDKPAIVVVAGTLKLPATVRVGSNKTILGQGAEAAIVGNGLNVKGSHNVIVRNLSFRDSADDAINVEDGAHHVWIDHCDFSKCHDGLIDVKKAADLVTVSWNRFHDHQKTCLVGYSDKPQVLAADKGKLRVTYHHNFFDGTGSRHPRVRVGETVHVFNNYFRGNDYGCAATQDAGLLVEGNFFEKVKNPTHTLYGESKLPGRLVERHNEFVDSGKPETAGTVKEPRDSYSYELDDAANVPELVAAGAGVGKL